MLRSLIAGFCALAFLPGALAQDVSEKTPESEMLSVFTEGRAFAITCPDQVSYFEYSELNAAFTRLLAVKKDEDVKSVLTELNQMLSDDVNRLKEDAQCSRSQPEWTNWRKLLYPEMLQLVLAAKRKPGWQASDPIAVRAADHVMTIIRGAYGAKYWGGLYGEASKAAANIPPDAAIAQLTSVLKAAEIDMLLYNKGFLMQPRTYQDPQKSGLSGYTFKDLSSGKDKPLRMDDFITGYVHWKSNGELRPYPVLISSGAYDDGRLHMIVLSEDSASPPSIPTGATLMVQTYPSSGESPETGWQKNSQRFEGQIYTSDACPGRFCINFPVEATRAIMSREQGPSRGKYAYQVYIGNSAAFPVPDVPDARNNPYFMGHLYLPGLQ